MICHVFLDYLLQLNVDTHTKEDSHASSKSAQQRLCCLMPVGKLIRGALPPSSHLNVTLNGL